MPLSAKLIPLSGGLLTVALVLTTIGTATAQEVEGVEEVEEIVVEGRQLLVGRADAVKTPTPLLDVPQSLSIITDVQIADQAMGDFGDVLRYLPGLSISQGEGHRDAIIIRGIQTTADFFIDGLRDDVQYFRPLYNVAQIEVLRGANALLFGRGGGGGVINRVQKRPSMGERSGTMDLGVDTFGGWLGSVDYNYAVNGRLAGRLNAYYRTVANHRDDYHGDSFAINPTVKMLLGPATTGVLSYEYVDDDRVVDRGVPSLDVANGPNVPLPILRDTFFGSSQQNRTTLAAHIVRGHLEHRFSELVRGTVTAQYADYDKFYQNLYPSDGVALVNGMIEEVELDGYQDFTDRQNFIVQANLVSEFTTGPIGHTLLAGAETGRQASRNRRNDNRFAANGADRQVIAFSDPLRIPAFGFTVPVRDRESDIRFASFYLQDQLAIHERLDLVAGFRYDNFDIDALDVIEANDGDADGGSFHRVDGQLTPRVGLIFKPRSNISAYLSYGQTFLPSAGEQFLTLTLDSASTRPQIFENRELGLKWELRSNLSLAAAVFQLERGSFTSVNPQDVADVILIDGSSTRGFEAQLDGNLTDSWRVSVGYGYLDGRVEQAGGGGNDGNETRQTPDHMFSVWNSYRFNPQLRLGLGLTWQDDFFVREDNAVRVPGYARVDAALYYQLRPNLRLQANVENLLNKDYFPDAHANNNISTGQPRNVRLAVALDI